MNTYIDYYHDDNAPLNDDRDIYQQLPDTELQREFEEHSTFLLERIRVFGEEKIKLKKKLEEVDKEIEKFEDNISLAFDSSITLSEFIKNKTLTLPEWSFSLQKRGGNMENVDILYCENKILEVQKKIAKLNKEMQTWEQKKEDIKNGAEMQTIISPITFAWIAKK